MDKKDYYFTKRVGREAYEQAIRSMEAIGEGGQPLPDVDQHRHPDYAFIDHAHDLTHEHEDMMGHIEHNEDRINALEHELEAIAETKETGEWELVSLIDFDIRGSGQMTLGNTDFTATDNDLTLHTTDKNGVVHGFDGVKRGDLVEIVEEHNARSTGDYGLYEVKNVNGMSFTLELQQGRGTADLNRNYFVKFFYLSDNVDIAELDARYAKKDHTHTTVPPHSHDPVPAPPAPPGRPFRFGSATKKGEFFVNSNGAYLNREDLNGLVRTMPTGPDFTWATGRGVTIWDSSGVLKWAGEGGQSTDWNGDTLPFGSGKQLYNKGLTTGVTYYVSVEGYW